MANVNGSYVELIDGRHKNDLFQRHCIFEFDVIYLHNKTERTTSYTKN